MRGRSTAGTAAPYLAFGGDVKTIITNDVGTSSQTVYGVHSFTNVGSATFTPVQNLKKVEYLIIGGAGHDATKGGKGGSGIVIVRYVIAPALTIVSPYSATAPDPTGTWAYAGGTILTNSITNSPVTLSGNTTQYVCTGFALTGNDYSTATATNITVPMTGPRAITGNFQRVWSGTMMMFR